MNEVSMCHGSRNRIEDIRYRPYVAWMLAGAGATASARDSCGLRRRRAELNGLRDVPRVKGPIERKSDSRIMIDNPSILPKYVVQSGILSSPHSKAADPDNMRIGGYY